MLWDYKIHAVGTKQLDLEEEIITLGKEGWELVSATDRYLYFKRQTAIDSRDALAGFYDRKERTYD